MGYHIVHLISLDQYFSIDQNRISIKSKEGCEKFVPIEDVAIVISATPRLTLTAAAISRLAENNIPLLICDAKYMPSAIVAPCHKAVDTQLLRAQLALTQEFKDMLWRKIVKAKVKNQADAIAESKENYYKLIKLISSGNDRKKPDIIEASAAQIYWKYFFSSFKSREKTRQKRTRTGVNGLLDYGYAVMRSAVLRYLSIHGFITAVGIHHTNRERTFALADDLMEPLRPFVDISVRKFIMENNDNNFEPHKWLQAAGNILTWNINISGKKMRLLYAFDYYVKSLAKAILSGREDCLKFPMTSEINKE